MSNEEYKRKIKNIKFAPLNDKYSSFKTDLLKISSPGFQKFNQINDIQLKKRWSILGLLATLKTKYLLVSMNPSQVFKNLIKFHNSSKLLWQLNSLFDHQAKLEYHKTI